MAYITFVCLSYNLRFKLWIDDKIIINLYCLFHIDTYTKTDENLENFKLIDKITIDSKYVLSLYVWLHCGPQCGRRAVLCPPLM